MTESTLARPDLTGPVYLAGPMTGLPDYNIPAFKAAEAWMKNAYPGVEIHSPHHNSFTDGEPGSKPYGFYFRAGLSQLVLCESAVFLDGWPSSNGAKEEYRCAELMGIPRYYFHQAGKYAALVEMDLSLLA